MLHRADRLAEVCYTLHEHHIEVKKIQFVGGRCGGNAKRAICGGKPACGNVLETLANSGTRAVFARKTAACVPASAVRL